jgi:hypothetical protein
MLPGQRTPHSRKNERAAFYDDALSNGLSNLPTNATESMLLSYHPKRKE